MEAIQDLSAEHEQPTVAASADEVDDMTSFFGGQEELRCTFDKPTAFNDNRSCPINDVLPICNELLWHLHGASGKAWWLVVLSLLSN